MKISELSKATGVSARSIRHYEKKKLLTSVRLDNDYRAFDVAAIERVRTIRIYLELGLTTDEIAELLNCHPAEPDPRPDLYEFCDEMLKLYEEKWEELDGQIRTMASVQRRLETRISEMKGQRERLVANPQ
ncbi:MerR family transcriptional regulator [Cohnella sp. REN36]|uniref:MerR family transcriptional regulator n=1 Tax=Cohnella sp. REN36 TaxID=2887347 RepID=UPI001D1389FF|nr:MerR family transcriptional regulator [Cohnella sp. REN36]MCC3377383.1 MerR family transcriptional regulator [Cohnella sp. REN36]